MTCKVPEISDYQPWRSHGRQWVWASNFGSAPSPCSPFICSGLHVSRNLLHIHLKVKTIIKISLHAWSLPIFLWKNFKTLSSLESRTVPHLKELWRLHLTLFVRIVSLNSIHLYSVLCRLVKFVENSIELFFYFYRSGTVIGSSQKKDYYLKDIQEMV